LHCAKTLQAQSTALDLQRPGRQATDVSGFQCDVLHVSRACAHIFRGDVTAAQSLDEAAVSAEEFSRSAGSLPPIMIDLPPPRGIPAAAHL